jgi:hypothetical protein
MKRAALLSSAVILTLAGCHPAVESRPVWTVSTDQHWSFWGKVLEVAALGEVSGAVVPVGPDPRFGLRLEVQRWQGVYGPWAAGSVVVFAIHSPTLLFAGQPGSSEEASWVGETYLFRLRGTSECGKTVVEAMQVGPLYADETPPEVSIGRVPVLGEELHAPSSLPVFTVMHYGIGYSVTLDGLNRVASITVFDPRFRTPEGIGVGSTLAAALAVATRPEVRKSGWGFVVELPSGWRAAFPPAISPQNPLPPCATVISLYQDP